ncbi:MAG: hypothetical protein LIV11_05770 [Bacillota bacterium]|nr:hypothetical protein [Bacillota bacterium]
MKQKSVMITADEVAEILEISRNKSYQIINSLNKQMKEENPRCIVIRGKANRKYFEESVYGVSRA